MQLRYEVGQRCALSNDPAKRKPSGKYQRLIGTQQARGVIKKEELWLY